MKRSPRETDLRTKDLFLIPLKGQIPHKVRRLKSAIWTRNKAQLIQRYLRYFVFVTKHGTYIDGFAGPQREDENEMWAAKLVLESRPRWLRHFFLFDADALQVARIEEMSRGQEPRDRAKNEPPRQVAVRRGDFNVEVHRLLEESPIPEKEAAFCLLDQRCFECRWSTVEALARHKSGPRKIELFYFLPNGWLDRSLKATKDHALLSDWWGKDDWHVLQSLDKAQRAELFCERFRELGYADVRPWPIYGGEGGRQRRTMMYMIHATDHEIAPGLMRRAYEHAVDPPEPEEQLLLELC